MEVYRGRLIAYSLGNFSSWETFSLDGPLGITAVLGVELAANGVALSAELLSGKIVKPGRPHPDPRGEALAIVRDLSRKDFDDALFDEQGRWRRQPAETRTAKPAPSPATPAAPLPGAESLLTRTQDTYRALGDFQVSFRQVFVDAVRKTQREEQGELFAKADGRVRWTYRSPTPKDFIFDGKAAFFYEPENAQVTVFARFDRSPLVHALRFLWGHGEVGTLFDPRPCRADCGLAAAGEEVVELWPRGELAGVDHSALVIDRATSHVRRSVVFDPLGNRTEYHFGAVHNGAPLADAKFSFTPPPGVAQIRAD
jgi:outer membrane lipoprotein-sorting protein